MSISVPVKKPRRSKSLRTGETGAELVSGADVRPIAPVLAHLTHSFQVGDRLRLRNGGRVIARAEAFCRVVARLPYEGYGSLLYRVRSEAEQFERVVPEADLSQPSSDGA
jgi:hypothetical protein